FTEQAKGANIDILKIGPEYEKRQTERLKSLRARRNNEEVANTIEALKKAMRSGDNTFPLILDCVKAYATMGEICDAMREVWGAYRETAVI
ncbi:MAG: methylmalonyl-CoA mutase family protein, partial [Candidatus Obscuribacterales bacterium]